MATPIPTNDCGFTLAEIVNATGGRLIGALSVLARGAATRGVSIDTRSIARGALFVALRGTSTDGHDYLANAAERGAAAAIVERGRHHSALDGIEVDDPLTALGQLAHLHLARTRSARAMPTLAIGGAAGKTSTKELIAALARALFGETLSTPGNLNNRIGVPMTIFTLGAEHRAAVLECGTNQRGEIAALARIVEPDTAVVLNVDLEHTEGLGTLEEIANEETSLFATAKKFAVASAEEPMVLARIPPRLVRITFGKSLDAGVRLTRRSVGAAGRTQIGVAIQPSISASGEASNFDVEIGLLGEASAINCTAAIAAVAAMCGGALDDADLPRIADALAAVKPVAGRLSTFTLAGIVVVDDTYNASPRSVRAALAASREVAASLGARLVIAMGDMLEFGAMSSEVHRTVVGDVLNERPAAFVAVGPEMRAAVAKLGVDSGAVHLAENSQAAGPIVARTLRKGDVLLVKGSRGTAMERIFDALREPAR
ncbi:MAG TPA: UDP-N-acetylmuramoyl-tripeptide--D-alanyl-D-alanine ligase [Candidatus Acidoferrales bacterium]|nr:UDP-N-acetylmuramoyl-tripeptide--D-alanyl-D-alanine ligase [Candidatus Acidoferrales bacterium]